MSDKVLEIEKILVFVEEVLVQIPKNSPMAKQIESDTTRWLSSIFCGLNLSNDNPEVTMHLAELIKKWNVKQTPLPPKISNNSLASNDWELDKQGTTPERKQPLQTEHDTTNIDVHKQSETNPIEFCWQLANCLTESDIESCLAHRAIKVPYAAPRESDIVVYGTTGTFPKKVWIANVENIPMFLEYFPHLTKDTQLWLSFTNKFDTPVSEDVPWLLQNENVLPLWRCWHNLQYWAILAQESTVFINGKREDLQENRESVCDTIIKNIHPNIKYALDHPEKNLIGKNLHRMYSAFYQFLNAKDLDPNKLPCSPFHALRNYAKSKVKEWLTALEIEEKHSLGVPKNEEYLSNIKSQTQKNVSISINDPFLEEINPGENLVLYWLKAHWKQKNPPQHQPADLFGSVLYSFD